MTTETHPTVDDIGADMIKGAAAIAGHIHEPVRRANHLLEMRQLPAFKIGRIWYMFRTTYRTWIEAKEAEAFKALAA